jgi:hypothetical protein
MLMGGCAYLKVRLFRGAFACAYVRVCITVGVHMVCGVRA